jgi:hypothetical protein
MSASAPLSADLGSRPESGFARREARYGQPVPRAQGGGPWGNHGFPHARQTEALRFLAELTQ